MSQPNFSKLEAALKAALVELDFNDETVDADLWRLKRRVLELLIAARKARDKRNKPNQRQCR